MMPGSSATVRGDLERADPVGDSSRSPARRDLAHQRVTASNRHIVTPELPLDQVEARSVNLSHCRQEEHP